MMGAQPERVRPPIDETSRHLGVAAEAGRRAVESSQQNDPLILSALKDRYKRIEHGLRDRFITYAYSQPKPGQLSDRQKHLAAIMVDFLDIATDPLFNIPGAHRVIKYIDRVQVERFYAEYYRDPRGGWTTGISYRPIAESRAALYPQAKVGLMLEKVLYTPQQDTLAIPLHAAQDVTEIYGRALYEVIRLEDATLP